MADLPDPPSPPVTESSGATKVATATEELAETVIIEVTNNDPNGVKIFKIVKAAFGALTAWLSCRHRRRAREQQRAEEVLPKRDK